MAREHDLLAKKNTSRSYLKILDQVRGQGVGRRKSGAYTAVCEHFEPIYNDAIGSQTDFEIASRLLTGRIKNYIETYRVGFFEVWERWPSG